ncbi:MAG: sugar kinase [Gemmiger sp.]|nr:sugar kinase [Gemmiger sp.]
MNVLSFGEILLRLAAPGYTKLFQKDCLESTFCGGEANVAVSLSVFGVNSQFLTKVPDNDVGIAAVNALRYFGVDTSKIIYGEGRMGLYYLEKGASQRPSKVIYDRSRSVLSLADRQDFVWEEIFEDVNWFHWTGISPALSENMANICLEACKAAKNRGITVSCDLNYRSSLWPSDKARLVMKEILSYVDICICNEEDADKALGIKTIDTDIEGGKLCDDGYVRGAEAIHSNYGCKYIATTLRKSHSASRNGWKAMIYDAEAREAFFSKEYDIQIVDRVGGGDSFAAGIIYGLINEMNNQEIVNFATAASCLKQTMEGDFNRSTVSDVMQLLTSGGNGRVQR